MVRTKRSRVVRVAGPIRITIAIRAIVRMGGLDSKVSEFAADERT